MTTVDFWQTRSLSWLYLNEKHPSRVSVMVRSVELIDRCIGVYETHAGTDVYARICGFTLLKAKNHALGSLSLILDGLGQESGALLRPMIEYIELLTYLCKFPDKAERAAENDLPSAGQRAKAIDGIYQGLREYLNDHASHSSYSHLSLSHLLTPELSFRKLQQFIPHVLDTNICDLTIQMQLMLKEGILALRRVDSLEFSELGIIADRVKARMLDVFALNST